MTYRPLSPALLLRSSELAMVDKRLPLPGTTVSVRIKLRVRLLGDVLRNQATV